MRNYNFNIVVWKEYDLFVALCLDLDIASQGYSREEALDNLKEALTLYFDEEPLGKWVAPILSHPELLQMQLPQYA